MNKNNKAVSTKATSQDIIDLLNKRLDAIEAKVETFGSSNKLHTTKSVRWLETMMEHNHSIANINYNYLMKNVHRIDDNVKEIKQLSKTSDNSAEEAINAFRLLVDQLPASVSEKLNITVSARA